MQSLRAWPGMKSESDTAILIMLNRFVSSSKRNYVQRRRDALKKNSDFTEELMAQEHERNSDEENKIKEALSRGTFFSIVVLSLRFVSERAAYI